MTGEQRHKKMLHSFLFWDLILHIVLFSFLFYKFCAGGTPLANILFKQGIFYLLLACVFLFRSLSFLARISNKKTAERIFTISAIIFLFFSVFVVSYTYITTSFKETTIPLDESYNVIIAEEIFEQDLFNVAEDKTSHIHITRPFWQTEVTEIRQSWNGENYFHSICVETDSFSIDYLSKELLRFIKMHGSDFSAEVYSDYSVGNFSYGDGYEYSLYQFAILVKDTKLDIIIYSGSLQLSENIETLLYQ